MRENKISRTYRLTSDLIARMEAAAIIHKKAKTDIIEEGIALVLKRLEREARQKEIING